MNEVYIGDNLAVMMSPRFRKKYVDSVNMIYIDPPYNTGARWSYHDKRHALSWRELMGSRLRAAHELLRSDGLLFVSIDDNEYANLRLLLDDIFGAPNSLGSFITRQSQRSNAKHLNIVHEYVVVYAKNKKVLPPLTMRRMNVPEDRALIQSVYAQVKKVLKRDGHTAAKKALQACIKESGVSWLRNYNQVSSDGKIYFTKDLSTPGVPRTVDIPQIDLHLKPLKTRGWSSDEKFVRLHAENKLAFKAGRPYEIHYLEDAVNHVSSVLNFYSRQGTHDMEHLGLRGLFDTPKPVELIKFLLRVGMPQDGVVLDFFAGSGTTAQAVYEVNNQDGRRHRYVLVQLDEPVSQKSSVYTHCRELGVPPYVHAIMLHRINTYLQQQGKKPDYKLIEGATDAK